MIPKKIENYSEFIYTLTPDEQQAHLETNKKSLKRLAELRAAETKNKKK